MSEFDPRKVVFLTDRWGDATENPGMKLSALDTEKLNELAGHLWDEVCFVVRSNDVYGILIEVEYDDGFEPSAEFVERWKRMAPAGCNFHVIKGNDTDVETFNNRWVVRAFLPENKAAEHWVHTFADIALMEIA